MATSRPASTGLLIQWVKQYRDQNDGKLPTPSNLPSDLAPIYLEWLASLRNGDYGKGKAMAPSALWQNDSPIDNHVATDKRETSFLSRGESYSVDTHVSDTPRKSIRDNDTECTSRQAAALPLFNDDFQSKRQHFAVKPTSSKTEKPSRTTARNLGAHDSPTPQKKYRANKENSAQLQSSRRVSSPLRNALKSPLSPVRGPIAQHSPSRVRQGAMKRKIAFSAFARVQEQLPSAPFALSPLAAPSQRTEHHNELHGDASAKGQSSQQHQASEEKFLIRANSSEADIHQTSSEQPLSKEFQCSLTKVQPGKGEMEAGQVTAEVLEQHGVGSKVLNKSSIPEVARDVFEFPADEHPFSSSSVVPKPAAGKPRNMGSTAAKVVRRTVRKAPAALPGSSDQAIEDKSAALKRKRIDSHCEAAGSDSEVSLECSEVFSESDAEMGDGERESESDRRPTAKAVFAKRARPLTNKGLTVAQLKQRLSEQGLSTTGRKADLEERLRNTCNDQAGASTSAGNQMATGQTQVSRVPNKQPSSGVFRSGKRKNFVRINLKGPSAKGKFQSKGARKFGKKRFSRFGRYQTKMLPQAGQGADYVEGCSSRSVACFKCGAEGHWARDCPGLPDPPAQAEDHEQGITDTAQCPAPEVLHLAMPAAAVALPEESMTEGALTNTLQAVFGFEAFRGLQLPVIQSVLRGTSTLAVLPTGAGKSLCYQVPALLCGGLVLVVSPLIALMKDQLAHLPKGLPGAMLWSGQQASQAMQTLRDIREGKVRVLYVAPERMGSPSLLSALAPMLPLPLVCIDEAHCIAEWGHNFRSAYFRLGRMLRENIPCRAVLALTATATKATEHSMVQALGISPSAVFRDASLRDNLRFHVHHTNGGTEAGHSKAVLLKLLKPGGALAHKKAVVVYTTFQVQAEQVAAHLHSHGIPAAAYHAGKHFKERESVQEMLFGKGRLRVVVATVAFGMGVDNRGVQAVVHLTLPQSLEEYVQQVGRAGRDGSEAMCHLFLDDADFRRLRSLSHSDAVSATSVMQFLETVFPPDDSDEEAPQGERDCYAVLGAEELACNLDMKAEVMETLLTYLEAHEESYVRVLPAVGRTVKVSFFSSTCQALAPRQPALQSLLAVCPKPRGGTYTVNMARWANEEQTAPSALLQQLAALARQDELRFEVDSKPTLTFQVMKRPASLEELAEALAERHTEVGRRRLRRLDTVYKMLAAAAAKPDQAAQEQHVREVAQHYFEAEDDTSKAGQSTAAGEIDGLPLVAGSNFMAKDVRMLLRESASMKVAAQLTGRAVARILHGLSSSAFPAAQWKKCGYWGRYGDVDFEAVLAVAEAEMEAWSK